MSLTIPAEYVDRRTKGLWLADRRLSAADFASAGHQLFDGPFSWPLMVLDRDALTHNIATMAGYAARHGMLLAPHGKTSMAPKLFDAQLDAGAWGITLATAGQVLTARGFGVRRLFLANELLDSTALRWAVAERERDPDFEFLCYVDSQAGIDAIAAALSDVGGRRDFTVLVELGHADGRTGVRTVDEVVALARAAAAVPRLSVVGVSGYEGGLPTVAAATDYLHNLRRAVTAVVEAGAVAPDAVVTVSAGGSAYFDAVADVLPGDWLPGRQLRVLLRSGAYLTHDDGFYAAKTPFNRVPDAGALRPAFQLWAQVSSTPEPELAIVAAGKRDAPYDEGLPIAKWVRRADGSTVDASGARVVKLNDQHLYLDVADGPDLVPGDLLCFGISHPCTTFDKWRVVPVVDADHRVVDLIHTYF